MATLAEKVNALPDRFKNNLTKEQQKSFVRAAIASGNEQSFYGMMRDRRPFDAWKKLNPPKAATEIKNPAQVKEEIKEIEKNVEKPNRVKKRVPYQQSGAKPPTEEDPQTGLSAEEQAAKKAAREAAREERQEQVRQATIKGDKETLKKLGVPYEQPLARGIGLTENLTPELLQRQGFISEDMSPTTKSLIYLTALKGAMIGDFYMIDAELGAAGKALKVGKAFQPQVLNALNESKNVLKQIEFKPRQPMQRGGLFGSRAGMADLDLLSGGSTGLLRNLMKKKSGVDTDIADPLAKKSDPTAQVFATVEKKPTKTMEGTFQGFEPVKVSPTMKKGRKAIQTQPDFVMLESAKKRMDNLSPDEAMDEIL